MTHAMPYFSLRTQSHGDGHGLVVTDVYGREGVSQLFEFDVTLEPDASAQSLVAPREFVHGPSALCFTADGSRAVHGVVVQADFTLAQDTGRAVYRLRLVPALWRATQAVRSRVYLDMTLPQLLRAVLHETGLAEHDDYVLALTQTYRPRPYTVQYNESDFDFLARRCEHEGVHFHFQHEEARTRVVFADTHGAFAALAESPLPYDPRDGSHADGAVRSIVQHNALRPRAVALRDYNESAARVVMNARLAPVDDALWTTAQSGLQSHYGVGADDDADAARLAPMRAEALAVTREQYTGHGQSTALHPGLRFALLGHPYPMFEAEMLCLSVVHRATQGPQDRAAGMARYAHEFVAIPATVTYRPPRVTPRPVMPALLPAVIDGPASGTPAPIDPQGRYHVVLPFDTVAPATGRKSCPMRLLSPTAGPGYGMHFPLHTGAHVMVAHLHDDPDRPVLVGALPNPGNVTPITQLQATRGALVTRAGVRVETDDDGPAWQPAAAARIAQAAAAVTAAAQAAGARAPGSPVRPDPASTPSGSQR
jgi:type VI secretion system secreted protein VgrG